MRFAGAIERLPLHVLLPVAFFLVGLFYWYAAPNFEASDTVQHVGVIKWIAERGELPLQSADHDNLYGQEASQPPLYYLLMAGIFSIMDTTDFDDRFLPSPFPIIGDPLQLGNKNLLIYKQVYPPDLRGSSLALYIIRLVSLGMGAVTVGAVYQSARTLQPARPGFALLAAAFTAFNPQFLFISASVSNDTLVNMLSALIAWNMLLMLRRGFQTRRSIILALLIALAALTKLSGLVPGFVAALAALWVFRQSRERRGFMIFLGATALCCLVIAGWWYLRNLALYGEPFGTATMLDNFGRRSISPGQLVLQEFQGLRISYWAVFGAFNIVVDDRFYLLMDVLTLLSAAGMIRFLWAQRRSTKLISACAFLALTLTLGAALLMYWSTQTWASTGRLLFPYITSASLFLALGLCALRIPPALIALPLLAFSLFAPIRYIIPNYDHPPALAALPEAAAAADAQWGDLRLAGYELPPAQTWSPGDRIPITLYWRVEAQSPLAYALALSLLDADGETIRRFETWPGWGAMPHPWMKHHTIYRDDYIMLIPADAAETSEIQLDIRWYVFPDGPDLNALLETGQELESLQLPLGMIAAA